MFAKISLLPSDCRQAAEALFDAGAHTGCVYWKFPVLRAENYTNMPTGDQQVWFARIVG